MFEMYAIDQLHVVPRAGRQSAGGPAHRGQDPAAPVYWVDAARTDGGNGLVDQVEISSQGRRLQVEARVRQAVLTELRLLAGARPVTSAESESR